MASNTHSKSSTVLKNLRTAKRAERRGLSAVTHQQHAIDLTFNLVSHRTFKNSKNIACYLSTDGEINTDLIIDYCWSQQKNVYLPVLSPIRNRLYFAPYFADSEMRLNKYGIAEPCCLPENWLPARQLDLVLLPLVAFDKHGNRLGMGGGYYDSSFSFLRYRKHWKKPRLIGLAHDLQYETKLPVQKWDIPVDHTITELKIY